MLRTLEGAFLSRDELASMLTQFGRRGLREIALEALHEVALPSRGAFVGRWSRDDSDPFPELMVVRDEDHADTLAWLSSYFNGLTPVTQWCRVLRQSHVAQITGREEVTLRRRLGPWVGAILAECSAQAPGGVNLRELPGTAALSSATFAAGRASAIWGVRAEFVELAKRHDEIGSALREGNRPLPAVSLAGLWQVIAGFGLAQLPAEHRRAMEPLAEVFHHATDASLHGDPLDTIGQVVESIALSFDLPDLLDCARGTQADRVKAVDRLADRLNAGPRSPAVDGMLGLGASLVDPGAAVLPDLLRKYASRTPLAPIWLGAFAGAWSPLRVLSDQQGLGRLVSKTLLADTDFRTRPGCDVAYEELSRWIGGGKSSRLNIRGMAARSLNVELATGVTCSFPLGRADPARNPTQVEPNTNASRPLPSSSQASQLQDLSSALAALIQRVSRLESARNATSETEQPVLDLPSPPAGTTKRSPPKKWKR